MTTMQKVITIIIVVIGTALTRFLPFLIFPESKKPPRLISYLGKVLPYAVMGLLIIYCLKDAVFTEYHALPELISIAVVVIIHLWRHNTLLSIGTGTVLYMVLVQNVFTLK